MKIIYGDNGAKDVRLVSIPEIDLALSKHQMIVPYTIYGQNSAVAGSVETIWQNGGTWVWQVTAMTFRIKAGGNAADDVAGAGAQQVTIRFLNTNWEITETTVDTAGASASAATAVGWRLLGAWVSRAGAYSTSGAGANTAAIQIENSAGDLLGVIGAGLGETQLSMFTIPAGKKGLITGWDINTNDSAVAGEEISVNLRFFKRPSANDVTTPFSSKRRIIAYDGHRGRLNVRLPVPIVVDAYTDLWWDAIRATGAVNVSITIVYHILLVDSNY